MALTMKKLRAVIKEAVEEALPAPGYTCVPVGGGMWKASTPLGHSVTSNSKEAAEASFLRTWPLVKGSYPASLPKPVERDPNYRPAPQKTDAELAAAIGMDPEEFAMRGGRNYNFRDAEGKIHMGRLGS